MCRWKVAATKNEHVVWEGCGNGEHYLGVDVGVANEQLAKVPGGEGLAMFRVRDKEMGSRTLHC